MTYFWSDTHFNHRAILGFKLRDGTYSRPYTDVSEMNAALVGKWNAKVGPKDSVWVIGDFGFHYQDCQPIADIFASLNGRKSLVIGNHDKKNPKVLRLPWDRMEDLYEFKQDGFKAVLCHYPLETWPSSHNGSLMLHGHCHGSLKRKLPKRFDLGVDTVLGADGPVSWQVLLDLASKENYFVPTDAHGDMQEGEL